MKTLFWQCNVFQRIVNPLFIVLKCSEVLEVVFLQSGMDHLLHLFFVRGLKLHQMSFSGNFYLQYLHTVLYKPHYWHFQTAFSSDAHCYYLWVKGCLAVATIQVVCPHIRTPRFWSLALCKICNVLENEHMTELLHEVVFFSWDIIYIYSIGSNYFMWQVLDWEFAYLLTHCSVSILHLGYHCYSLMWGFINYSPTSRSERGLTHKTRIKYMKLWTVAEQ